MAVDGIVERAQLPQLGGTRGTRCASPTGAMVPVRIARSSHRSSSGTADSGFEATRQNRGAPTSSRTRAMSDTRATAGRNLCTKAAAME